MPLTSLFPAVIKSATLAGLSAAQPVLWINDALDPGAGHAPQVSADQVTLAAHRMRRFAPLLAKLFPELGQSAGLIQSPLIEASRLQPALGLPQDHGRLWIKADHSLPVAGSVKARGGFHEVLEFAEDLAQRHGLVDAEGDYAALAQAPARELFSSYRVAVGSTGNLGMAIGIMAAALGFEAIVHMSADARAWKKARLRSHGVKVIEYSGDYAQAVAAGRLQAADDPHTHFVDDEASLSLMLGYAVAGQELKSQLDAAGIVVDATHPLFVYLPCGVGGAPAGISIGLRQALGPHVHCFFAEPVQSPCFVLRMMQGEAAATSVYDIGLSNRTEADGLAVPRASELAAQVMQPLLVGAYTVQDHTLFEALAVARDTQDLRLEPSAAAGLPGPLLLTASAPGRKWLADSGLLAHLPHATHLAWTTGGAKVPDEEFASFYARAKR